MSDLVGYDVNDYGTRVSVHECGECGDRFTVCPAVRDDFGGCQDEGCASYDPDRDVDSLFDSDDPSIVRRTVQ